MPNTSVVIIGGGISGVAAALNLAQRGVAVDLVEREPRLGGNTLDVCCKAVNGQCQHCGGCLVAERLRAVCAEPLVTVHLSSTITNIQPAGDTFSYQLVTANVKQAKSARAVIAATGFDHIDARTKGPYGYGALSMVITGEDMERRLRAEGQSVYDCAVLRDVAFIQCVGSRDEHANRGWCSQVCCRYAVRLARLLGARSPQTNITIFKMDIQTAGRDSQAFALAQQEGIRFICGLPAVVRRSEKDSAKAALLFDDINTGQFRTNEFDLVVLATGIEPRSDALQLAETLGVERNRFGFLASQDGAALSIPGIFAAGCCQSPRSISESIVHATAAAEACYRYLQEHTQ
ncbi:MAG: FAD-dependent oxidoreductase [Chloroflexi bacterium]|nr:FAD-dependent oxidoreductase [Chloroflexota bacterium]